MMTSTSVPGISDHAMIVTDIAILAHDYLTPVRNKRQIESKKFTDCVSSNSVERQSTNNSKCFKPTQCHSELYRNSFFPKTVIDWNHLDDSVVCVS